MADVPGIPAGLPLIESACEAADLVFSGGPAFWDGLDERAAACRLEHALDRALAGRPAPRVWILVHEPGRPELAVAGALAFARSLAERGQAALVLDGDDQNAMLTRWAGREHVEGWIDVVRYGTSLLASGVPLPFAGRTSYLVGVGSYAPTDAGDAEVEQLLARLRRQADDILVVVPGGAAAAPWALRADIRLLCHDQALLTPQRLAAVVANLTVAGVAPTALLGFGKAPASAAASMTPVADASGLPDHQEGPSAESAEPEPLPPLDPDPFVPAAGAGAPAVDAEEDEACDDAGEAAADEESSVLAALDALAEQDEHREAAVDRDVEYARRRGTSGVFWMAAAAVVVLIGLVGAYYLRYVRVPDGSVFGDMPVTVTQADDRAGTGAPVQGSVVPEPGDLPPADQGETLPSVAGDGAGDASGGPGQQQQNENELGLEAPSGQDAGTDQAAAPAEPAFDPAPYRGPVGDGGWALQVYSLRDLPSAEKEIARLERLGLMAAARPVELPDTGRWWRVYVGSFASRAEARAAEPALFRKLRIDWAKPTRYADTAPDSAGR